MKRIPTFEQFLNEKAYRLSGYYSQKGFLGANRHNGFKNV